jgi:hypothetical protein
MAAPITKSERLTWPAIAVDCIEGQWFVATENDPAARAVEAPAVEARAVDARSVEELADAARAEVQKLLESANSVVTTEESRAEVTELTKKPVKAWPRLQILSRPREASDSGPQLVFWMGKEASSMVLAENGNLGSPVTALPPLTMLGVWNDILKNHKIVSLWAQAKRNGAPEQRAAFEKFLGCVRTGKAQSVGGATWFLSPHHLSNDGSIVKAFMQAREQADPQEKAHRVRMGGYAAGHIDLREILRELGLEAVPENPENAFGSVVIALRDAAKGIFGSAVDAKALAPDVAEIAAMAPVCVYRLARDLARGLGSPDPKARLEAVMPWRKLVDDLDRIQADLTRPALAPPDLPRRVRELRTAVEGAAVFYKPEMYLEFLDAAGPAAGEKLPGLLTALAIQPIRPTPGEPFQEGPTVEAAAATGAPGDEYIKSVAAVGYATQEGRVVRKARVNIERRPVKQPAPPPPPAPTQPPPPPIELPTPTPGPWTAPIPTTVPPPRQTKKQPRLISHSPLVWLVVLIILSLAAWGIHAALGLFRPGATEVAEMDAGGAVYGIVATTQWGRDVIGVIVDPGTPALQIFAPNGGQALSTTPISSRVATVSADGSMVAVTVDQTGLEVFGLSSGKPPTTMGDSFTHHTDVINALLFLPAGAGLASGSSNAKVIVWDPSKGTGQVLDANGRVISLAAGGNVLAAGVQGADKDTGAEIALIEEWTTTDPREFTRFGTPISQQLPLDPDDSKEPLIAISGDGKALVVASGKKVWLYSGALHRAQGPSKPVKAVAISTDGKRVVAAAGDALWVWHWDSNGGELDAGTQYPAHDSAVSAMCFIPELNRWATGAANGSVKIWEIR